MYYRLYKPQDFTALYAVEQVCFQPPHRFSRSYMRQLLEQPNAAAWIAEDDGRMCGFALVEWAEEDSGIEAYIQTLEVLPGARGQGVGAALLQFLHGSARDAGADSIWLHVKAANAAAIHLYERYGYELEGREADYYGPGQPGLVYSRLLSATSLDAEQA